MSQHLLRPQGSRGLSVARGQNAWLSNQEGQWLDLGGANHGAAIVGHNHPAVIAAMEQQLGGLIHVPMGIDNPERDAFLAKLHGFLPDELTHSFLANSGTEAVEAAIKLAMTATGRSGFVAAKGCFHGRTLGALGLMDRPAYRKPFAGRLAETQHVSYNDPESLHAAITNQTAALVLEPVQGEGGVRPAHEAFLRAARDLTEDRGAMLIFDEVQTGLGRTGTFLRGDAFGITPDIVTLGKGVAGGLPVGVTSCTQAVAEALPKGSHGTTYGGSPLVCAAGSAVLGVIEAESLLTRSATMGAAMQQAVAAWELPVVREVRGAGMMLGIDLRVRSGPFIQQLQQAGVLALGAGPTVLRLLPPLTISQEDLDHGLSIIHDTLARAA